MSTGVYWTPLDSTGPIKLSPVDCDRSLSWSLVESIIPVQWSPEDKSSGFQCKKYQITAKLIVVHWTPLESVESTGVHWMDVVQCKDLNSEHEVELELTVPN